MCQLLGDSVLYFLSVACLAHDFSRVCKSRMNLFSFLTFYLYSRDGLYYLLTKFGKLDIKPLPSAVANDVAIAVSRTIPLIDLVANPLTGSPIDLLLLGELMQS